MEGGRQGRRGGKESDGCRLADLRDKSAWCQPPIGFGLPAEQPSQSSHLHIKLIGLNMGWTTAGIFWSILQVWH